MTPLDIVEAKNKTRYRVLLALWQATGGKELQRVHFHNIAAEAGLTKDDADETYIYLTHEGFFAHPDMGGGVTLSHKAILEIEQSILQPNQPTEHFSATVIQNFHGPVGAVQTGTNSSAFVTQNVGIQPSDVMLLLRQLRGSFESLPYAERSEALEIVDALEEEVDRPDRRLGRIKAYLTQAGTFALKTGTEVILSNLAHKIVGSG